MKTDVDIQKSDNCVCEHKNILWSDTLCMIYGYKKDGICIDCKKTFLKDIDGRVIENNGIYK